MFVVEFDTREVDACFASIIGRLEKGFPTEMRRIDQMLARSIDLDFRQGGRPKWKPPSAATVKQRRRTAAKTGRQPVAGFNAPLRVTDRLRRSVTALSGAGVPGQVSKVGPLSLIRGTSEPQARRLQEGQPERSFLHIRPQDKTEAVDILAVGLRQIVHDSTSSNSTRRI